MIVLAFDTATADTAVGLLVTGHAARTARHTPAADERPGHATRLLGLARGLLAEAGLGWSDVDRIGVGTGPGTFTGLRIGVATARAIAQAGGQELVPVSTLQALALGVAAASPAATPVLACVDARRGEAYVAAWRGTERIVAPRAVGGDGLAALLAADAGPWRAAGDGSVGFRAQLEAAGAIVEPDDSPLHHVDGAWLCELASLGSPADRDTLEPEYVRSPDAIPTHLRR